VRPFLARSWTARPSYSYVVSIADLTAAWARVEQNLRRLVTRCGQQGLVVTDDDDFDSFFTLHAATMERKDAAVYLPRPAFATFVTRLLTLRLCRLFHVRTTEGRVVASQLVLLGAHPICHTVSAAADPAFNKLGVSAFLRWKAFEALSALGYRANDLTDASLNPVTHFKSQLGGDLQVSFVLESRPSRRFRWGSAASETYRRVRQQAGVTVHRLLRRSP
jgi:lipid II:glycine glycyltransferase (peptidoglycan interpeptide bridge formation enzyme)